jgi:hypothetical protein
VVRVPQPPGRIGATTSYRQAGPTGPVEFWPPAIFLGWGVVERSSPPLANGGCFPTPPPRKGGTPPPPPSPSP